VRRNQAIKTGEVVTAFFVKTFLSLSAINYVLTTAPTLAADKLRVSYASVTGNTAGITYIAPALRAVRGGTKGTGGQQ